MSGRKPLAQRPGLSAAVAAVERGDADILYAAYFDRLFRSLRTQDEVVERVGRGGGRLFAVDVGEVSDASAATWLSETMQGAVSEYQRRSVKERSARGQADAVARGAVPWSRVALGYRRLKGGRFEPDPATVPIVQRAYEMRADGATMTRVRAMLTEQL